MAEEPEVIPGGELVSYPVDSTEPMTVEDAARDYTAAREKALNPPAESAEPAPAEPELAVEANADPIEDGTTGEDPQDEPEVPAIDPPRSWSKDAHERWSKLDRETQEFLASRDSEDQKVIKTRLNEAAEARKAAEAERTQASKDKEAYQSKLPALMQALQDVSDREFPDIKSMADYERYAMEAHRLSSGDNADPFRALQIGNYLKAFDAHQQKVAAVHAELQRAEGEKRTAQQTQLNTYKNEQDAKFLEYAPELSDPKKKAEAVDKAVKSLVDDIGFSMDELNEYASDPVAAKLLYSAGFQKLVLNNLRLGDLKAAPLKAVPKNLPPVQRPGASKPAGAGVTAQIQALEKQLSTASGDRAARISADIYRLEKRAAAR